MKIHEVKYLFSPLKVYCPCHATFWTMLWSVLLPSFSEYSCSLSEKFLFLRIIFIMKIQISVGTVCWDLSSMASYALCVPSSYVFFVFIGNNSFTSEGARYAFV